MSTLPSLVSRRREGARRRSCLAGGLARAVGGALLCAAAAATVHAHASAKEGEGASATGACSVLTSVYRTLEVNALAPAERQRLSDTILAACARTEIRLLRADTLEGAAILRPLAGAPEKGAEGQ